MDQLSSRERVRLALEHQASDRIPIAMVCSGINQPVKDEFEQFLQHHHGCNLATYLSPLIDIKSLAPEYIGPALKPGTDIWGVERESVSYGDGAYNEISHYPLAKAENPADLDLHDWPSPDWFDYPGLPEKISQLQKGGEFCLIVGNGNVFESSWYMRGFEQIFMDMVLNPELVHEIATRVTDFYVEFFHRVLSAAPGKIDLIFTADDIGSQSSLLMSLEMWEEFIKPQHTRLNRAIHEHGAKVIYHSDGAVMPAVPGLIDMGIDVLQALQFDADGMDPAILKERHGHELCFEGGVSVQSTLPFGSPDEVRQEVQQHISILGKNGGYILGPSHAIQAGTPPENIYAMFETARNCPSQG